MSTNKDELELLSRKDPYYVLGLDPGIASCGFALIDLNNHEILEMGSRLFKTPQENKTKTSLAKKRRNARSSRRNTKRRKDRQKHVLATLKKYELVPQDAEKQWMQTVKGDKPILELRGNALNCKLSNRELAQVLYSLSGRRGYIPHGIGNINKDIKVENDDGKVLKAIKENSQALKENETQTVGELLYKKGKSRNTNEDYSLCVLHDQIVDEAKQIIEKQSELGNEALINLTPARLKKFKDEYLKNLSWEKPSIEHDAEVYKTVGKCSYFKDENRAANADLSSEMLRAYERFSNVVIVTQDEEDPNKREIKLPGNVRENYIKLLFSPSPINNNKNYKVNYSKIRKDLDLTSKQVFKNISSDDEKNEVFEPKAWRKLRSCLPEDLMIKLSEDMNTANAVGEALTYASSSESLERQLGNTDLSKADIKNIIENVPYTSKVFNGYGKRSLKAISMLLDCFIGDETGSITTLYDAEMACGLGQKRLDRNLETKTKYLPPYTEWNTTNKNPVVIRALSQMRKIINSIITIYGVPNEIHIELGRDLKHSKKEKKMIYKANKDNETKHNKSRKIISEITGINKNDISRKLVTKYEMWVEQGEGFDAYTGERIEIERLLKDPTYTEIDHILPYSRTNEDSRHNKVLVLQKSNQDKRERTPYEWMTSGEKNAPKWNDFMQRVINDPSIHPRKRRYLLNNKLDEESEKEFLQRNLNDTRYMCREVKQYIEDNLMFPGITNIDDDEESSRQIRHVLSVAGGATAKLRHTWGLNTKYVKESGINKKDREDDRHHAVDACVIAACNSSTLQKVAKLSKYPKGAKEINLHDTQPWPSFSKDVLDKREKVIPTHMVSHKVSGRAFEDTVYSAESYNETDGMITLANGKRKGNFNVDENGGVHLYDGIAFIRLWLDEKARPNGKVKGEWLVEPVYYADIPKLKSGTYIPRYIPKTGMGRYKWMPITKSILSTAPIVIHTGDVVLVDEKIGRFNGININTKSLTFKNIVDANENAQIPPLSKWGIRTQIKVIHEDCLGHCWTNGLQEIIRSQQN